MTLREANDFVEQFHRHNGRTSRDGGKFAIGAWQAMGGKRLVTYTLPAEGGASLRGSGWKLIGESHGHKDGWATKHRARDWQPIFGQTKFRWEKL
jgi:hypothetical protein